MARTIKARAAAAGELLRTVQEYVNNRMMRERSAEAEDGYKKQLMEVLAATGELQEGDHRFLPLDEPISYVTRKGTKVVEKMVTGIQRQCRKSNPINEDRAMDYLKRKGLLDQCTTTVTVLDEGAIFALNMKGDISDKDLDMLMDHGETYAFYLVTEET